MSTVRPLVKSAEQKIIFLYLNQSICCGYAKVIGKKILTILWWERSGSVVECLTRDRGAAGSSLSGITPLCP